MVQNGLATVSPLQTLQTLKINQCDLKVHRRSLEIDEIRRLLDTTAGTERRFGMGGYKGRYCIVWL